MVCVRLRRLLPAVPLLGLLASLLTACSSPEHSTRYSGLGSTVPSQTTAVAPPRQEQDDYDYTADPGWVMVAERERAAQRSALPPARR